MVAFYARLVRRRPGPGRTHDTGHGATGGKPRRRLVDLARTGAIRPGRQLELATVHLERAGVGPPVPVSGGAAMGDRRARLPAQPAPVRRLAVAARAAGAARRMAAGALDAAWPAVRLCRAGAAPHAYRPELGNPRRAENCRQPGRQLPGAPRIARHPDGGAPVRLLQPHVHVHRARPQKPRVPAVLAIEQCGKAPCQSRVPGRHAGYVRAFRAENEDLAAKAGARRGAGSAGAAAARRLAAPGRGRQGQPGAGAPAGNRRWRADGAGQPRAAGARARSFDPERHRGDGQRWHGGRAAAAGTAHGRGRTRRYGAGHERAIHPRAPVQTV